tara:strand:- start:4923 stop:5078 length:156 start_codon:yes stop_codon:yes gene_type:complete
MTKAKKESKKIVIITFESHLKEAHPYSLETLDLIANNGCIIDVEIIDYKGV